MRYLLHNKLTDTRLFKLPSGLLKFYPKVIKQEMQIKYVAENHITTSHIFPDLKIDLKEVFAK